MPSSDSAVITRLLERLGVPEPSNAGERQQVEFKSAQGGVPKDMWETVSAFANTGGGWIVLGIKEHKGGPFTYEGVDNPEGKLKEIHDQLRNPQKISHPVCGEEDVRLEWLDGRERPVVVLCVPECPRRQRPVYINNNPKMGTYVRRHTGDHRCDEQELARMYREAGDESADSEILPHFGLDDLDRNTFDDYRQRFQTRNRESPRTGYDDQQFLTSLGAYRRDRGSGGEGLTLAGLLLFGTPEAIRERRNPHRIDFRLLDESDERWEDRLLWEGNLLGAYYEIFKRLTADLPVRFRLEGDIRASETPAHTALREALVNCLVHADYAEREATLITRSPMGFGFRNPGNSRVSAEELHAGDRSSLRNPSLTKAFREIGLAEEGGTGIPSILRAWNDLGFCPPEVDPGAESDRYEFRLRLPYSHLFSEDDRKWLRTLGPELNGAEALALVHALHEGRIDNQTLRGVTGQHSADVTKVLSGLSSRGLLRMEGAGRGAYYELATVIRSPSAAVDESVGSGPETDETEDERATLWVELERIAEPVRSTKRVADPTILDNVLVRLCGKAPLAISELATLLGRKDTGLRGPIQMLIEGGQLSYLYPENPRNPKQKYVATSPSNGERKRGAE